MRWLSDILKGDSRSDPIACIDADESDHARSRREEALWLEGITGLTGRDLSGWIALIDSQGFTDKNETIDWLREQHGFSFPWASRLERIHANGGRPIYAGSAQGAVKTRIERCQDAPSKAAGSPAATIVRRTAAIARAHAASFLLELQERHAGEEILASVLAEMYLDFCEERAWPAQRWGRKYGVAQYLRTLNSNPKTYRDVIDSEGRRRRLSVYPISAPGSGKHSAPLDTVKTRAQDSRAGSSRDGGCSMRRHQR